MVGCKSCKTLFCTICIKRNIGEDCLSNAKGSGWQCCRCSPNLVQQLNLELEKAVGSSSLTVSGSDSDSDNSDEDINAAVR